MIRILSSKPITLEEAKSINLFFVKKGEQVFISNAVSFGKSRVRLTNLFTTESYLVKEEDVEKLELFTGEISINID